MIRKFVEKFHIGQKNDEPITEENSPELRATNEKIKPFHVLQEVRVKIEDTESYEHGWVISTFNDQINEVILLRNRGLKKGPEQRHVPLNVLYEWNKKLFKKNQLE